MEQDQESFRNLPSIRKLREQLDGMHQFEILYRLSGLKDESLEEAFGQLPKMEKEFERLVSRMDMFNRFFSDRGWIVYDSLDTPLIEKAVALAESSTIDEAEACLVEHYCDPDILKMKIKWLKVSNAFLIRYRFLQFAKDDFLAGRYYSCIPLLLMIVDGVVSDLNQNRGFFAEQADLELFDSLVGHTAGLVRLKELFSKGQNKTSSDPLDIPLRNAILHGRALAYDNKLAAAKTWALVFAVGDWAKSLKANEQKREEHLKEQAEKPKNIADLPAFLGDILEKYNQHKAEMDEHQRMMSQWQPRSTVFDQGLSLSDLSQGTPEREVAQFLENVRNGNYGAMAKQVNHNISTGFSLKTQAGRCRQALEELTLLDYSVLAVNDMAPAISTVKVLIRVEVKGSQKPKAGEVELRGVYVSLDGRPLIRGQEGGRWAVNPDYYQLGQIAYRRE